MRTFAPAVAAALLATTLAGCSGSSTPGSAASEPRGLAPTPAAGASPVATAVAADPAVVSTAVQDATQFAKTYYNSEYRKYVRYSDSVVVLSTGPFLDRFQATRDAARKDAVLNRQVRTANVRLAAPVQVTATGADVLMVVDQTVSTQPKLKDPPRTSKSSVRVTAHLRPVNGGWLVDGLNPVARPVGTPCVVNSAGPDARLLVSETCRAASGLFALNPGDRAFPDKAKAFVTAPALAASQKQLATTPKRAEGATIRPEVAAVAVTKLTGDTGEALVFLNQTITIPGQPAPATVPFQLLLSMQKVGAQWLVSGIRTL